MYFLSCEEIKTIIIIIIIIKEQTSKPIHEGLAGILNGLLSEKVHDDNKTTSYNSSNKT